MITNGSLAFRKNHFLTLLFFSFFLSYDFLTTFLFFLFFLSFFSFVSSLLSSHRTPATRFDVPAPVADTLSKVEIAAVRLSQEEHDLRATVTALAACHEKEAKAKIALEDAQEAQPDSVRAIVFFY